MDDIDIKDLTNSRNTVNTWMERYGVRFGIYKYGDENEKYNGKMVNV